MSTALALLVDYAFAVLFTYVFATQVGAPLPAAPLMMAAGALTATGRVSLASAICAIVLACLCADSVWYALGRAGGGRVVRFLCSVSFEPEACVRRTEQAFVRYGASFVLVAKFLPALSLMAAPIAGQSRMRYLHFLAFDAIAAVAWAAAHVLLGRFLGSTFQSDPRLLHVAGRFSALIVAVAASVLAVRVMRRRRSRRELSAPERITPVELKRRLDLGELFYVVDLRSPAQLGADRRSFPGAVHLTADEVIAHRAEIPSDRDVVLFCDCPGEASAAKLAAALRKQGVERVHPLQGGLDAWKLAGYPLTPFEPS